MAYDPKTGGIYLPAVFCDAYFSLLRAARNRAHAADILDRRPGSPEQPHDGATIQIQRR